MAVESGDDEVVKFFIEDLSIDPSLDDNYAIKTAAENDYLSLVELLLKDLRIDPGADDNYSLRLAIENDYFDIFKLLIEDPRVDTGSNNNAAIRFAFSAYGLERDEESFDIVKFLLKDPRVDPSVNDYEILREAEADDDEEIIEILEKERAKYPNYTIRRHNLQLENQVEELQNNFDLLEEERFNYIKLLRAMEVSAARHEINSGYQETVELQITILNLQMSKINKLIKSLKSQQDIFYRENT